MKSLTDCFVLSNGVQIPCVGFGTWDGDTGNRVGQQPVIDALAAGYRHIDTAAAYENEKNVGLGIKASGIPREELFITSKLDNPSHGYEATQKAFEQTMADLDLEYLDLYLIHWPNPIDFRDCWKEKNAETWKAFEEYYDAGRIRAIGISNFYPHHIEALMETATITPMVNQLRICPGEVPEETIACCKKYNMLPEAYSPLGTGSAFEVAEIQEMAKKYNKTVAQVCLRWSLQMGFLPLPKSVTASRIQENAEIFDFELSAEDVIFLAGLTNSLASTRLPEPDEADF